VTRRISVLAVGVVLLLVAGLVGAALPVPYVAQVPGPTFNTLGDIDGDPVISVRGRDRNEVSGNLNLTTVGVGRAGLSLVEAVRGWFDDEISIVPEETVYPPGQTEDEIEQANREAFLTSEESAEAAALGELGYPVKERRPRETAAERDGLESWRRVDASSRWRGSARTRGADAVLGRPVAPASRSPTAAGAGRARDGATSVGADGRVGVGICARALAP
jgi:hypothetical protein